MTAPIAIGAARGPQIFACTTTPGDEDGKSGASKPFQAAAKIYDPLYYRFKSEVAGYPRDSVVDADEDYRAECAAYEHLHTLGQSGSFAPEYYGSWTFTLPITVKEKSYMRNVRLILLKLLHGTTIQATRTQNSPDPDMGKDSFHYPEGHRLEILSRAMDGYVKQLQTGLVQGDFAGRNVMLVVGHNNSQEEIVCGLPIPRIVLIDYNHARIINIAADEAWELPPNPAEAFWVLYLWHDFPGWATNEWEDEKLQQQ